MTVEDEVRLVDSMIDLYAAAHHTHSSQVDAENIDAAVPDLEALKAYIATNRKCVGKSAQLCVTAARVCYSDIRC